MIFMYQLKENGLGDTRLSNTHIGFCNRYRLSIIASKAFAPVREENPTFFLWKERFILLRDVRKN